MMEIELTITKRTDARLLERMRKHYSQPKGFVGRNICYAITYGGVYYGHIVAGSATKNLPGRHAFLGTDSTQLNRIVNNIFYNVSPVDGKYPVRNFTTAVLKAFMLRVQQDWRAKYGDSVVGFESLVEPPRSGELYRRAGWTLVGRTKGYTCKRVAGKGTDGWSGIRVWDHANLRPNDVWCWKVTERDGV